MNKLIFFFLMTINSAFSQDATKQPSLNFISDIMGQKGLLLTIGVIFFTFSYFNSVKLFAWIEDQTYGTRDFILQKCELLFIEVRPERITYGLLFLAFGFSIIALSLFFLYGKYTQGFIVAILLTVFGWKIPRPLMNYLVSARIKKFETQMVDGLNLLSNGLRAGLSLPQSLGMVVEELPKPISQEFNLILQQTKIGVTLDEAFENLVKRVPTEDNDMFVSAINILRETGGNLAEVFDTIANVIRERIRLKQKIDTFVAQGKMQGGLIFCMPIMMGAYFGSTDPQFFEILFGTPIGIIVTLVAAALNLTGGYFMLKVIKIKV